MKPSKMADIMPHTKTMIKVYFIWNLLSISMNIRLRTCFGATWSDATSMIYFSSSVKQSGEIIGKPAFKNQAFCPHNVIWVNISRERSIASHQYQHCTFGAWRCKLPLIGRNTDISSVGNLPFDWI